MTGRGLFVTFEGIDGSGKTTQRDHLAEYLSTRGIPVLATGEPGGTPFGQDIRDVLTNKRDASLSDFSEALLINAARHNHVHSVIIPALDKGRWVLCDRFIDSTFAYQFYQTELDIRLLKMLNTVAVGDTIPDRTYIFDIEPALALDRRAQRQCDTAACDPAEAYRDYDRIRRGFQEAYANETTRCVLIDVVQDELKVRDIILQDIVTLDNRLNQKT